PSVSGLGSYGGQTIDPDAKDLITKLLTADPLKRIGYFSGSIPVTEVITTSIFAEKGKFKDTLMKANVSAPSGYAEAMGGIPVAPSFASQSSDKRKAPHISC